MITALIIGAVLMVYMPALAWACDPSTGRHARPRRLPWGWS